MKASVAHLLQTLVYISALSAGISGGPIKILSSSEELSDSAHDDVSDAQQRFRRGIEDIDSDLAETFNRDLPHDKMVGVTRYFYNAPGRRAEVSDLWHGNYPLVDDIGNTAWSSDEEEKRAPGLDRRAPGLDRRAPGLDRRAPGLDRRAPGLEDKRAPGLEDKRAPGLEKRTPGLERRAPGLERRAPGLEDKRAPGLERRAPGLERRAPGLERRAPGLERRAPGLDRRAPGLKRGRLPDYLLPALKNQRRAGPEFNPTGW